ncbi:hypothetical protein [Klugiella xanthotipulae]|uniref:hypothetical protein n=1 Tax=Klugiella xanthotipulae TaxID=244735 RepID=UPI0011522F66|nr:hypothetical protein [Klugiella xanthotipulae]
MSTVTRLTDTLSSMPDADIPAFLTADASWWVREGTAMAAQLVGDNRRDKLHPSSGPGCSAMTPSPSGPR